MEPQWKPRVRALGVKRLKHLWLGVTLTLVALAASACIGGGSPGVPSGSPTAQTVTQSPAPTSRTSGVTACAGAGPGAVGVFRATDPAETAKYEAWLGCRVDVAIDFSARATWADIATPTYLYRAWDGQDRRLALGVAMLPDEEESSMAAGAAGEYDQYFTTLAEGLVEHGEADAILRLGWEFNLEESRWFTRDTESFKTYWRRIATAMNAVGGSAFVFDWNPNNGRNPVDATAYYPGDDVVDVVGVDAYDVSGDAYPYPSVCNAECRTTTQRKAWDDSIFGGERGLRYWRDFAIEHDKPLSVPEWGLWQRPDGIGGGDNVSYIQRMHAFLVEGKSRIAYHAYFESNGDDGEHRLMVTFEDAGTVFRKLMTTAPPQSATATPS